MSVVRIFRFIYIREQVQLNSLLALALLHTFHLFLQKLKIEKAQIDPMYKNQA